MDIKKLPFSPATQCGFLTFISGQIGIRDGQVLEGGVAAQTRQALENLEAVLKAAGLKRGDVVKVTVFLRAPSLFPEMNEVYAEFFASEPPARSCVIAAPPIPGADIEIEAIAFDRELFLQLFPEKGREGVCGRTHSVL